MKTTKILFAALTALAITSCDDFLDMQPTQSGNAEGSVKTVTDAEVAINGMMSTMTSSAYYGRNFVLYGDTKGGDLTIYSAGRGLDALYSFNHAPSYGSFSGFWLSNY